MKEPLNTLLQNYECKNIMELAKKQHPEMNMFSPEVQASIFFKIDDRFLLKARKQIKIIAEKY